LRNSDSIPARVLLTATTWWPLSARLAVRLLEHGCTVLALCPPGHLLGEISGIGTLHSYNNFNSMASLDQAVALAQPDLVVPCDDRAVAQLHALYESHREHRALIERSLGAPEYYNTLRSRAGCADLARDLGVPVAPTRAIASEADIRDWFAANPGRAALKVDGSTGGHGVQIVDDPGECILAWRRMSKVPPAGQALKRWLVDSDPLAFWGPVRKGRPSASLQKFIPGRDANAMVACWEGQVLGTVAVEVLCSQGATGASTIVRLINHPEIEQATATLVRGLRLSGFCGFDFILQEGSRAAWLIEVNPRCTQLGHLVLPGRGDLAGALCAPLGAPPLGRAQKEVQNDVIAFFPQALRWNPDSPLLDSSDHDVPWTEPRLVSALLREPWPHRRWLSRAYHRLRPRRGAPGPRIERTAIDLRLSKMWLSASLQNRATAPGSSAVALLTD
jgi:ATP-grasp domain